MQPTTQTNSPNRITLQAEGAVIAAICVAAYAYLGGGWGLFALLILTPDTFMLGYLAGKRAGAIFYNVAHSYVTPALLGALGWAFEGPQLIEIALIWGTHIGADRAIGYGLKYASGFKDTHLARA